MEEITVGNHNTSFSKFGVLLLCRSVELKNPALIAETYNFHDHVMFIALTWDHFHPV